MQEPLELRAGDTIQWQRTDLVDRYPSDDGWNLKYHYSNKDHAFTVTATATPGAKTFDILISATDSAAYNPGVYTWVARVDKAQEEFTVDEYRAEVRPNLSSGSPVDDRTHAEKVLSAIEAVIERRASIDQQNYTIGGRSLGRTPLADLIELRNTYRAEVDRLIREDKLRRGLSSGQKITTRFV